MCLASKRRRHRVVHPRQCYDVTRSLSRIGTDGSVRRRHLREKPQWRADCSSDRKLRRVFSARRTHSNTRAIRFDSKLLSFPRPRHCPPARDDNRYLDGRHRPGGRHFLIGGRWVSRTTTVARIPNNWYIYIYIINVCRGAKNTVIEHELCLKIKTTVCH